MEKNDEGKKFPQFIKREHNEPLFFCGLYQKNTNIEFSIITTAAKGELADIHHRMPVILKEEEINNYLNAADPMVFLNSHENPELVFYEVSRDVNNPSNNHRWSFRSRVKKTSLHNYSEEQLHAKLFAM